MERNLNEQPIARILVENKLTNSDLISASTENITYKMLARACKGRRLTPHVQVKICNALNRATGKAFTVIPGAIQKSGIGKEAACICVRQSRRRSNPT